MKCVRFIHQWLTHSSVQHYWFSTDWWFYIYKWRTNLEHKDPAHELSQCDIEFALIIMKGAKKHLWARMVIRKRISWMSMTGSIRALLLMRHVLGLNLIINIPPISLNEQESVIIGEYPLILWRKWSCSLVYHIFSFPTLVMKSIIRKCN